MSSAATLRLLLLQLFAQPLTMHDIRAMFDACTNTRAWITRAGRLATAMRQTFELEKAIILFFLDTGCHVSELCGVRFGDLTLKNGSAFVLGQGSKRRVVAYGPMTGRALFRHLAARGDLPDSAPVFESVDGKTLTRTALLALIRRIGERAGISGCHPHRMRHTSAATYLGNGGNIYTLQRPLGHSSLDMVKRYLAIVGANVIQVHRLANPVENML